MTDPGRRFGRSRSAVSGVAAVGVSSATNFLAVVFAARNGSPESFGAVSLGFTAYLLAQSLVRSTVCEMLLIGDEPHRHESARRGVTAAALLGMPIAGIVLIVGLAVPADGPTRPVLLMLAACIVPLCVQDTLRYVAFSRSAPLRAAALDLAWAAVFGLGLIMWASALTSFRVWIAWCVGGAVVGLAGAVAGRHWCTPATAVRWLRSNLATSGRYILENLASQSVNGVAIFALGALAGTAAVGAVRGVSTLFGPLTVLHTGVYAGLLSQLRRNTHQRDRVLRSVSVGLVGAALLGTGVWLLVPTSIGTALLGATWASARALVLPFGVGMALTVASSGAVLGLRALVAAATTLRIRLITAPITLVMLVAGSAWAQQRGYSIGFALSSAIGTALLWFGYRQIRHEAPPGIGTRSTA